MDKFEGLEVYPALKNAAAYFPAVGAVASKVVVGVASVDIKPGSSYIGLLQPTCELVHVPGDPHPALEKLTWPRLYGSVGCTNTGSQS